MNINLTNYNNDLPITIEYKSLGYSSLDFSIPFTLDNNVLSFNDADFQSAGIPVGYELYVMVKQNEDIIYEERHVLN